MTPLLTLSPSLSIAFLSCTTWPPISTSHTHHFTLPVVWCLLVASCFDNNWLLQELVSPAATQRSLEGLSFAIIPSSHLSTAFLLIGCHYTCHLIFSLRFQPLTLPFSFEVTVSCLAHVLNIFLSRLDLKATHSFCSIFFVQLFVRVGTGLFSNIGTVASSQNGQIIWIF